MRMNLEGVDSWNLILSMIFLHFSLQNKKIRNIDLWWLHKDVRYVLWWGLLYFQKLKTLKFLVYHLLFQNERQSDPQWLWFFWQSNTNFYGFNNMNANGHKQNFGLDPLEIECLNIPSMLHILTYSINITTWNYLFDSFL